VSCSVEPSPTAALSVGPSGREGRATEAGKLSVGGEQAAGSGRWLMSGGSKGDKGDKGIEVLRSLGITTTGTVHLNPCRGRLYEEIVRRCEGVIADNGAVVVRTGAHTGRAADDKYIVSDSDTRDRIRWGPANKPMDEDSFDRLLCGVIKYLSTRDVFVQDLYVCAHSRFRMPVRVVTELAWHSLFARNMFIRPGVGEVPHTDVGFTVVCAPGFESMPERYHTRSETVVVLNMTKRIALIGGTAYAGEIKKSVFTFLNYVLPMEGVFPMHCAGNADSDGNVALFFGLSGTGKTTLSAHPGRMLIGDDELGWYGDEVFNFEGGCYAKVYGLRPETEPDIYRASTRWGTVLENVIVDDETRQLDFSSAAVTENTRSSYPLDHLDRVVPGGVGGRPRTIFMLSYDAFGVLPPIAKLTPEQAVYFFLLGYTAKVAGTEAGVAEPRATFSPCFGAPFLPLPPVSYARMLQDRLERSRTEVWLLNTGLVGGPWGVGSRMPLAQTRALVQGALDGTLGGTEAKELPILGLRVPVSCPGVEPRLLDPVESWGDEGAYKRRARELVRSFEEVYKTIVGVEEI